MTTAEAKLDEAARALRARGIEGPFTAAMVLGTGLSSLADGLADPVAVPFMEIPGFPHGGVSGHRGQLVAGSLGGARILAYQGRAHFYEHGDAQAMRIAIGVLSRLGRPPLLLTNAAGSTRADLPPGSLVAIRDHINFSGINPLVGDTDDARFVSMTGAYDEGLTTRLKDGAARCGIGLQDGVYMWFSGPSFETPAEVRMARLLGADLVGMSTVPEVIFARRHGLKVAALSVVTNFGAGIEGASPSHHETKDVAARAAHSLQQVAREFVAGLGR